MDLNLNLNVISQHFTRCQVTKNGLFEQFEYIPSRYSLADEIMMKDRLEDEAVTLSVGGKPFIAGTQKIKLKHETAFEDKVLPGTAFHTWFCATPSNSCKLNSETIQKFKKNKLLFCFLVVCVGCVAASEKEIWLHALESICSLISSKFQLTYHVCRMEWITPTATWVIPMKLPRTRTWELNGSEYNYNCHPFFTKPNWVHLLILIHVLLLFRIEDSKILHGPFIPSGTKKSLNAPSRAMLPEICKAIHRCNHSQCPFSSLLLFSLLYPSLLL